MIAALGRILAAAGALTFASAATTLAQAAPAESGAGPIPLVITPTAPAPQPGAVVPSPPPAAPPPAMPSPAVPSPPAPSLPPAAAPPPAPSVPSWLPRTSAELQALDRIDNRAATLNVPVGQSIQFEHITITVRACVARPTDQAPDAAAFLQIVDARPGAPSFTGWMLVSEPYASMLQHPVFDVRVLACH